MRASLTLAALCAVLFVLPAQAAKLPTLNITCPGITMHVEKGNTTINGESVRLKRLDNNSFSAGYNGTTVSIALAHDGSASATYTGRNHDHGLCAVGS